MSNTLNLSIVGREITWTRIDLPNSCYEFEIDNRYNPPVITDRRIKSEVVYWLMEFVGYNNWQTTTHNQNKNNYNNPPLDGINSILFKKQEDAILFATTWF